MRFKPDPRVTITSCFEWRRDPDGMIRGRRVDAYDRLRDDLLDFPPDDDRDAELERRWFGVESDHTEDVP